MKSGKLQCKQGSRYWTNDHKNTSICFLQQTALFFTLCAREKLQMEHPRMERPQGTMVCQSVKGQEQATEPASAIDLMCDLGQTLFPLWALLLLAFHCYVIQNSVKCCCSDLITFSFTVAQVWRRVRSYLFYFIYVISCYSWYNLSRLKKIFLSCLIFLFTLYSNKLSCDK